MNNDTIEKLLVDTLTRLVTEGTKKRNYGSDNLISFSEIHMISIIAEHEGIHVGGLAETSSITKPSVSEMVTKLEKKGFVEKRIAKENLSKKNIYLTEAGRKAHLEHMKVHKDFNKKLDRCLENSTEEERNFLHDFLIQLTAE